MGGTCLPKSLVLSPPHSINILCYEATFTIRVTKAVIETVITIVTIHFWEQI